MLDSIPAQGPDQRAFSPPPPSLAIPLTQSHISQRVLGVDSVVFGCLQSLEEAVEGVDTLAVFQSQGCA